MDKIIVWTILSLVSGCWAESLKLFTLPPLLLKSSPSLEELKAFCNATFGSKCYDCSTMVLCLGVDFPVTSCTLDKPYCDKSKNICTTDKPIDPDCEKLAKTFKCPTAEGFYPHPSDCNQFFECHKGIAYNYRCPAYNVWSMDGMGCKIPTSSNDCGKFQCTPGAMVPYTSSNSKYYAYCDYLRIANVLEDKLIMKCPDRMIFNSQSGSCDFICPSEGLFKFANDEDPTSYHRCYKSMGKIIHQVEKCTADRIFNEEMQLCVDVENDLVFN